MLYDDDVLLAKAVFRYPDDFRWLSGSPAEKFRIIQNLTGKEVQSTNDVKLFFFSVPLLPQDSERNTTSLPDRSGCLLD